MRSHAQKSRKPRQLEFSQYKLYNLVIKITEKNLMFLEHFLIHRRAFLGITVDVLTNQECDLMGLIHPLPKGWKTAFGQVHLNEEVLAELNKYLEHHKTAHADILSLPQKATAESAAPAISGEAVVIYTDGACKGNPGGRGGWGAILRMNNVEKELFGGERDTTNNRMELMAAIMALEALKRPCKVVLHTDSKYVQEGISQWIHGWKRRGWKTADKQPVKNEDLWRRLDIANGTHEVTWTWVKGHAGNEGNERADGLANKGCAL